MIYMIDEDVIQLRPFALELKIRGYEVVQIDNADEGYRALSEAKNIELVLVDIMLTTEDKDVSRYSRESTRDFLNTGLLLLQDLIYVNPTFFPSRAVIFSMSSQEWLVSEIKEISDKHKIPYLRKSEYPSPFKFGNVIDGIIKSN